MFFHPCFFWATGWQRGDLLKGARRARWSLLWPKIPVIFVTIIIWFVLISKAISPHKKYNYANQYKKILYILTRVAELLDLLSTIYLFVVVPRSLTETTCCLSMVSDVTTPAMNGDLPCDIWCRWAKIKETIHAKIERYYTRKITLHMSTGSWTLQQ